MKTSTTLLLLLLQQAAAASIQNLLPVRRLQDVVTERECELGKWLVSFLPRIIATITHPPSCSVSGRFAHKFCLVPFILAEKDEDEDTGMTEEITFKCKAKTEDADTELKDEIKFKVEREENGVLKVKVEYEQEVETEESETETETQYEVYYERLVEYRPSTLSETDAFAWGESEIVVETPLVMGDFSAITDSGTTSTFSISSTDDVATFTFTISRSGDEEDITANKMKIDFELKGYQWAEDDTYIALVSTIVSQREVEIDYEDSEDGDDTSSRTTEDVRISFADAVDTTGVSVFGEYTWAKDAMVLGLNDTATEDVTIEVIATSPADGGDAVAFSFVGDSAGMAGDIYWDPEVGVGYTSSVSQFMLSSVAILASATFLLLL